MGPSIVKTHTGRSGCLGEWDLIQLQVGCRPLQY
jgi:hypothetical protein